MSPLNWLTRLFAGEGNVVRDRSYTNWNEFDADALVARKRAERADRMTPRDHADEGKGG